MKEEEEEDDEKNEAEGKKEKQEYISRMITCTRCETQQETKYIQLRTKEGYRALHCKACGRQERCSHSRCQCNTIWHQCRIHRVDPGVHASRKGVLKKTKKLENNESKKLSLRGKAPVIKTKCKVKKGSTKKRKTRGRIDEEAYQRHVSYAVSTNKPREDMVQRIRIKMARITEKQKEEKGHRIDAHTLCQPPWKHRGAEN